MNIKRIPTQAEGNPHYPLPPDYLDLIGDGQRQARTNACRQWLLNYRTPEGKKDVLALQHAYVSSLNFFDRWYLWPDDEADFNPLFYDDTPMPTPEYHWFIARNWISYRRTATVAMRGGAKSFLNAKDILLRNTTRPAYSFVYATSSHKNVRDMGERLKRQWLQNQRIQDDWRIEFPDGTIRPKKGEGGFGVDYMMLGNGSWVELISAKGKQRGKRPRRYRLDDPEFDPEASTPMNLLREWMEQLLFKVVIPMVARPETGVDWIGTFVSRRHYLWHAMSTEETPEGIRAVDSRFDRWARLDIPAEIEYDRDGELTTVSAWPDMWPLTIEDRLERAKEDPRYEEADSLEEIRMDIGERNYNSEYRNKPGASEDSYFPLNTEREGPQAYWYENVDQWLSVAPHRSSSMICWKEYGGSEPQIRRMTIRQFIFEYARLFITGDTSNTHGPASDPKAVMVMAQTPTNDLFVLDLWQGRVDEPRLIKETFRLADRWRVPAVHVEAVKQGVSFFNGLYSIVSTRATDLAGDVSHFPAVRKISNMGNAPKEQKISGMLFRFEYDKIKLPMWLHAQPMWVDFFSQITDFNPEVEDGGLQHDDLIDVLQMSNYVLRGRLHRTPRVEDPPDVPLVDMLKKGQFVTPNGVNIAQGVDIRMFSVQDVEEMLAQRERSARAQENNNSNRTYRTSLV